MTAADTASVGVDTRPESVDFLAAVFPKLADNECLKLETFPKAARDEIIGSGFYANHSTQLSKESIGRFAERFGRRIDTYVCVTTQDRANKGPRRAESALRAPCLWADIDYGTGKVHSTRESALAALDAFTLQPTAIVETGHGFHAWWRLASPTAPDHFEEHLALVRGLAAELGGDQIADMARVLRLPGSLNLKEPSTPLPVALVALDREARYSFDDFEAAGIVPTALAKSVQPTPPTEGDDGHISEGRRNTVLISIAGGMRARNLSAGAIRAALLEENRARCAPPLPEEEVEAIAHGVLRYPPGRYATVRSREDGVIVYEGLQQVRGEPISYSLRVSGKEVILSRAELWAHPQIRKAALDQYGLYIAAMSRAEWETTLADLIADMTAAEVPEDATDSGIIWGVVREFLLRASEEDERYPMRAVERPDGFIANGDMLRRYLHLHSIKLPRQGSLWDVCSKHSAVKRNLRIAKTQRKCWWFPREALEENDD